MTPDMNPERWAEQYLSVPVIDREDGLLVKLFTAHRNAVVEACMGVCKEYAQSAEKYHTELMDARAAEARHIGQAILALWVKEGE